MAGSVGGALAEVVVGESGVKKTGAEKEGCGERGARADAKRDLRGEEGASGVCGTRPKINGQPGWIARQSY